MSMADDAITELRTRAAELEAAAKAIESSRAGAVAAQPPATPAADALPAADATQPEAAEQPPGLTREQLDGMSREEVLERMDEVDAAMRRGV
jgi:hypothetical protein